MAPPSMLDCLTLGAAISLRSVFAAPAPEPKVIAMSFEKKSVPISDVPYSRRLALAKRSSSNAEVGVLYLSNTDSGTIYLLNATIGTPGQPFQLTLDTGSSDLWVPWANSDICTTSPTLCATGSFDDTKSSTFVNGTETGLLPSTFDISYGDGTHTTGDYMTDTLSFAGATILNMTMGLATDMTGAPGGSKANFSGLVGVGFDENESINFSDTPTTYPGLLSQLVDQGMIHTRAFSLWLNELSSVSGSVIFGGVDSSKYSGDLVALPLQASDSYTVTLAGVSISGDGGKNVYSASTSSPCLLDSGAASASVPMAIGLEILNGVGGVNVSGTLLVPCDVGSTQGVFSFQFGDSNGPIIKVPISEFVMPLSSSVGDITFSNGKKVCEWGLTPKDSNRVSLGDPFLRSAFLVYNIDGKEVAIAQANFHGGDSSVAEITASDSIPGVTSTASGTAAEDTRQPTATPPTVPDASPVQVNSNTNTFALGSPTASTSSTSTSSAKSAAARQIGSPSFVGITTATSLVMILTTLGSAIYYFA